jgi:hypothetical protein
MAQILVAVPRPPSTHPYIYFFFSLAIWNYETMMRTRHKGGKDWDTRVRNYLDLEKKMHDDEKSEILKGQSVKQINKDFKLWEPLYLRILLV